MIKYLLLVIALCGMSWAAGGTCPSSTNYLQASSNTQVALSTLGITSCYFISPATGADTNSGTTESTPWAHSPYEAGCSNTCAGVTPAANEGFIYRGGETILSKFFTISHGGSSTSNPIYFGVDQAWFTGASWNRPIVAIAGTTPNTNANGESRIFDISAGFVIFDNLEITGGTCTTSISQNYFYNEQFYDGIQINNGYFHAFQPPAGSAPSSGCGATKLPDGQNAAIWIFTQIQTHTANCSSYFMYNLIDGTDGSGGKGAWTTVNDGPAGCFTRVAFNVAKHVCSGISGYYAGGGSIDDNVIGPFSALDGGYDCSFSSNGIHNHAIRSNGELSGGLTVYNNVITGTVGEVMSFNPGTGTTSIVNNVFYTNNTNAIELCDNGSGCSAGTVNIINNTIDAQTGSGGSCLNVENPIATLRTINNFDIFSSAGSGSCYQNTGNASSYPTPTGEVYKTLAQANTGGYNDTQTYAYSPTSGASFTVGTGTNETGVSWPSISTNDSTYACSKATIGSVTQVSCPARTSNTRPSSGAWDTGAYEFGSTSSAALSPSSLNFGVQAVGTNSASQNATLTNSGGATLNISGIAFTGTNTGDFSKTTTCGSTLAASTSCTISVTFTPTTTGSRAANVVVTDDSGGVGGSTQTTTLSGTGTSVVPGTIITGNIVITANTVRQ